MECYGNIKRVVKHLLNDPKVQKEIKREGVWFREYKLPDMLRFVFELTPYSLQFGFYDVWNGDVVKDEVYWFRIRQGEMTPTDYLSGTSCDRRMRRIALDKLS